MAIDQTTAWQWNGVAQSDISATAGPPDGSLERSSGVFARTFYTDPGATPDGNRNRWQLSLQCIAQPSGSPASYEAGCLILWAEQNDPSRYVGVNATPGDRQILRDLVPFVTTCRVNVQWGRGWSRNGYTYKAPGIAAFTVGEEWDLENHGQDCTDPNDSLRGAWGVVFECQGTTPQTVCMRFGNEGGSVAHYLLHAAAGSIAPGGSFISSDADFAITMGGKRIMWSQVLAKLGL